MEQSLDRHRQAGPTHIEHKRKNRIKWSNRFNRFNEDGFLNPDYDKANIVLGKIAFLLIITTFIVLLVMVCFEDISSHDLY